MTPTATATTLVSLARMVISPGDDSSILLERQIVRVSSSHFNKTRPRLNVRKRLLTPSDQHSRRGCGQRGLLWNHRQGSGQKLQRQRRKPCPAGQVVPQTGPVGSSTYFFHRVLL